MLNFDWPVMLDRAGCMQGRAGGDCVGTVIPLLLLMPWTDSNNICHCQDAEKRLLSYQYPAVAAFPGTDSVAVFAKSRARLASNS